MSRFHRVDWRALDGPTFFAYVYYLPVYGGALARLLELERAEAERSGDRLPANVTEAGEAALIADLAAEGWIEH